MSEVTFGLDGKEYKKTRVKTTQIARDSLESIRKKDKNKVLNEVFGKVSHVCTYVFICMYTTYIHMMHTTCIHIIHTTYMHVIGGEP